MCEIISAVFCLLIGIPLIAALLTYGFFWYETANSDHRPYLDRLANGSVGRILLKGICSSYSSSILTILFYPFGYWRRLRQPEHVQECSLPPVILVHGLYHNPSAWVLYRRWLKRAGFKNVYAMSYGSWRQSFENLLGELGQVVGRVSRDFPGKKVILIGHSLGGLLSRAYVETVVGRSDVEAVVTLGAPHQGSKLAALGLGRLARSLIYHGPLIERLEQNISTADVPRFAVFSALDNMVLPNAALKSCVPGWIYQETSPVSHVAMLYHKPTAKVVLGFLESIHRRERK